MDLKRQIDSKELKINQSFDSLPQLKAQIVLEMENSTKRNL